MMRVRGAWQSVATTCGAVSALIALVTLVAACSATVTPHKNFVNHLNDAVGKTMTNERKSGLALRPLIDTQSLSSGHMLYRYQYIRTCRYTLEVDKKTGVIVAVSWEGSEKDCVVAP